jgi:16S rRNA (uracil1498-N3)-methyltransferase
MNLVLLEPADFLDENQVRLQGRRLQHIRNIHRVERGSELRVGVVNGKTGTGRIDLIDEASLEMTVRLTGEPPPPLPLRLVLALPRPKVLNRTIAAAASMGIREIDLINAWRVEKAYLSSPRLTEENLRLQSILGLEQSGDTILPAIRLHKLFTPFVRDELPRYIKGSIALLAHPGAGSEAPRRVAESVVLAIGPEGGFIDREVSTFREIGFTEVTLGPRILRVETALACLVGRLF